MNISRIIQIVNKFSVDNSPLILTAIGVTGTVTTAVLAGKASYKAADILRAEDELSASSEDHPFLTKKERVKLVAPLYISAVSSGAMTIACLVAANRIGTRRAAAMAAAYTISEKALEEYKDKVIEKFGPKKEQQVRDEVAQERVNANPVGNNTVIMTGGGKVLCFDSYTGRYFESDMESIKQAQNNLNHQLLNHQYASLNDFYDKLGLPRVKSGDEIGWNADKLMEITFSTVMSDDNRPCISIDFQVAPVRSFYRVH